MKSSQGFVEFVIGCSTRPGNTSVYTKEICKSNHGVRGTQKIYIKVYISHWHGPTSFAPVEAKEVL